MNATEDSMDAIEIAEAIETSTAIEIAIAEATAANAAVIAAFAVGGETLTEAYAARTAAEAAFEDLIG